MALRAMGKREEARAELNALLAMYPRYDKALLELGELNAGENKWKEAEAAYRQSYAANPGNIQGLLAIAYFKMDHNQAEEAIEMLRSESKKFPDRVDLRLAHAAMASRADRWEEAATEYKVLLTRLDHNPKALSGINLRLGELYFRSGHIQQSLGYLEKAKQLQPEDSAALHTLGVAYDVMGRKKEAAALYEACLRIDGEDPVVMNNLAYYISQNGGSLDLALKLAQRAHRSMPNEAGYSPTQWLVFTSRRTWWRTRSIFSKSWSAKSRVRRFSACTWEKRFYRRAIRPMSQERAGDSAHEQAKLPKNAAKIKTLLGKNGA